MFPFISKHSNDAFPILLNQNSRKTRLHENDTIDIEAVPGHRAVTLSTHQALNSTKSLLYFQEIWAPTSEEIL